MTQDAEDKAKLIGLLQAFMAPMKGIEFSTTILALTGCNVTKIDCSLHGRLIDHLIKGAHSAGSKARSEGIYSTRPNEAGNRIEPFVREAITGDGFTADTPTTMRGKKKSQGYPDICVYDGTKIVAYLECKTYADKGTADEAEKSQRSFYFSPSSDPKITASVPHLLLSYEMRRGITGGKVVFRPISWHLYTLENLKVDLKHEFNADNSRIYAKDSLLATARY